MAYGTFTLTINVPELGGGTAEARVDIRSIPSPLLDTVGKKIFDRADPFKTVGGVASILLPTNSTSGTSTTVGYHVTVRTKHGTLVDTEFYARQAGATLDLTEVTPAEVDPVYPTTQAAIDAAASAAAAASSAASAAAVGSTNDTIIAGRVNDSASATRAALSATFVRTSDVTDPTPLRAAIRGGKVSAAHPIVFEGDSHVDPTTTSQYFRDRLLIIRNEPGEGLEGVPDTGGVVQHGNNGQTLALYLSGSGTSTIAAATAYDGSSYWLAMGHNDPRLGGFGSTKAAMKAGLLPLFLAWIDYRRAANPTAIIGLRIDEPYTTVPTALITVDPQLFTDAYREAAYEAAYQRPGTLVYDAQTRLFGTTSPTSNATYYGDALHLNQAGYYLMADDFASWVAAAKPVSLARQIAAVAANPTAPWTAYSRDVEDPTRYVTVAEFTLGGTAGTVQTPTTFFDAAPVAGPPVPGIVGRYDLIQFVGGDATYLLPSGAAAAVSGANVRFTGLSISGVSAMAGTKVRLIRRTLSSDSTVNTQLLDSSVRYKRTGRWITTGTNAFGDIEAISVGKDRVTQPASEWPAQMVSGDKVYVEGVGLAFTIGTDATATVSGSNLRLNPIASADRTSWVNKLVVVTGSHA